MDKVRRRDFSLWVDPLHKFGYVEKFEIGFVLDPPLSSFKPYRVEDKVKVGDIQIGRQYLRLVS